MGIKTILNAKKNANDEFYTSFTDVEKELNNYIDQFIDKIIYCPCDDFYFKELNKNDESPSAFIEFFLNKRIKIKKLITSAYNANGSISSYYTWIPEKNALEEHKFISSNGDFRSKECIELLKEAEIIITNPPFSLFRDFISLMEKYEKKFLIVGNINAITYKDVFKLIKKNEIHLGYHFGTHMHFIVPDYYSDFSENTRSWINENEQKIIDFGTCGWFTNLNVKTRPPLYTNALYYSLDKRVEEYPKYDNYDAIHVAKTTNIPLDYNEVMGVPISFLNKYCPEQFEIVGLTQNGQKNETLQYPKASTKKAMLKGKTLYPRILIRKRT